MEEKINTIINAFGLKVEKNETNSFYIGIKTYPQKRRDAVVLCPLRSLDFTKTGFKQLIKLLDKSIVEKTDYTIVFEYSKDGYDYWTKQEKKNMPISIKIEIMGDIKQKEFEKDLYHLVELFYEKYQKLLDCDSYLRRC